MEIWQSHLKESQFVVSQAIYFDDPAWISILDKLSFDTLANYKMRAIMGAEVTMDWFFEQTQNLSLFQEKTRWNILNAEKIPTPIFNRITKEINTIKSQTDTLLWFWFPLKSKKKIDLHHLVINEVSYWQKKQFTQWLMKAWKLNPTELDKLWPWEQELTLSQHLQLVEMLQMGLIEQENLIDYFQQIYFDQEKFELISLLDQKQFPDFWSSLKMQIDRADQTERLRLVQLIRSHLFKMAKFKENPNAYLATANDKKIMQTSKQWLNRDILRLLRLFSDFEILAKSGENLQYKTSEQFQLV